MSQLDRKFPREKDREQLRAGGFTLIELLVGMTFLTIGLLAIAAMFPMAYVTVNESGKMTMTLTAARQILEDVRSLPFVDITDLHNFDTNNVATLPADEPMRGIVRRWRYALAGEGNGFTFTSTEKDRWAALSSASGTTFGGRGRITVTSPSATMRQVTITISIPRGRDIQLSTLISRM